MKLISVKCPNCGSTLELDSNSKQTFCSYCGTKILLDDEVQHHQIHYDNAEDAGYQFEKGRQKAQAEQGLYPPSQTIIVQNHVQEKPKKKRIFWWIMGWIFIFPIPATILFARSKKMSKVLKIILIAAVWLLFLSIALGASQTEPTDPGKTVVQPSESSSSSNKPTLPQPTKKPNNSTAASTEKQTEATKDNVPIEYKNALASAKSYSNLMNMSKASIYDQLTSEYGDKFSADAAQYAIDNLDVDYKANALKSAESYSELMHMSKAGIYDQLISEYGDKFTKEEAQYAVDNLKVDYKANAFASAKAYQSMMKMSKTAIYDQLVSEYGDKFTPEEAQYAIDHLDD